MENLDDLEEVEVLKDLCECEDPEDFEIVHQEVRKWFKVFVESKYFENLSEDEKMEADFAIDVFAEYMYNYIGQNPCIWNIYGLRECCVDVLPRKVTARKEFSTALPKVLKQFFLFLDENEFIKNGKSLAEEVINLEGDIIKAMNNSSKWGLAKTFMMNAMNEGVDISDQEELNKYISNYNDNINRQRNNVISGKPKIGRNEPCPCGSGKKYKKCCINKD